MDRRKELRDISQIIENILHSTGLNETKIVGLQYRNAEGKYIKLEYDPVTAPKAFLSMLKHKKWAVTRQFLKKEETMNFLKRMVANDQILDMFRFCELLDGNIDHKEINKDQFMFELMKLLYQQTETDPPIYVSHAVDHSIRVMNYSFMLFETIKEVQDALLKLYGLNFMKAQFVVGLIGLVHDVGYTDLTYCSVEYEVIRKRIFKVIEEKLPEDLQFCHNAKNRQTNKKFLHSISGCEAVKTKLGGMLKDIFAYMSKDVPKLYKDVTDSIRFHNFDVANCSESKCIAKFAKEDETQYLKEGVYKREYVPVNMSENPLLGIIRFADNLDFVHSRLSPVQQNTHGMILQKILHDDEFLRKFEKSNSKSDARRRMEKLLEENSEHVTEFMNQDDKEAARIILNGLNSHEFLHNYSNWIVKKSTLTSLENQLFLLKVEFMNETDGVPRELLAENNYNAAIFQINRMAESLNSVTGSKNYLDLILVKLEISSSMHKKITLRDYLIQ